MKRFSITFLCLALLGACSSSEDYTQYVNPFIGTLHEGHCFPGASVPMGMVQVSPESTTIEEEPGFCGEHVAGYQYDDPCIMGFTQTHINGAGCPTLSDIMMTPYSGRKMVDDSRAAYVSRYDKASEKATPGYYRVALTDNQVEVEVTASEHAGFHHYIFHDPDDVHLVIDLQYGVHWDKERMHINILDEWHKNDSHSISGYRKAIEWTTRELYYYIEFDQKMAGFEELPKPRKTEVAPRIRLTFPEGTKELNVKIGLSTTSVEAAKQNMESEIAGKSFEKVYEEAKGRWNQYLSLIDAQGDPDQLTAFYTSIYHLYLQPNNIADVDGKYRTAEGQVRQSEGGKFLTTLSLWDTYRAAHPMYTILTPSLVPEICASIMDHYRTRPVVGTDANNANRYLPRWALWGRETNTMIGNHAVPVLVDAYMKGLYGGDEEELYEAIHTTLTKSHYRNHIDLINQYGYIPYDVKMNPVDDCRETVSRLLEGTYDFHCAALLASAMGKADSAYFQLRAQDYRNVYDAGRGFFRGRKADGSFMEDTDPALVDGEWVAESSYTEGNAYHYLFHVQHDVPGMMDLMGKTAGFCQKLDEMFDPEGTPPYVKGLEWNIYGTIGQYWHGNEPCHHVPYLYKFTEEGYKTDEQIRYIIDHFSKNVPDGLAGNDDCGQMSAWYLFSSMGFYPVDPCDGGFVLGAPQLPYMKLNLENGKHFEIFAHDLSKENIYVQSIRLDGKEYTGKILSYEDIMKGGTLEFRMGNQPVR